MKCCILQGSPRKKGNTASLINIVSEVFKENNIEIECIWLYDKNIKPCRACRVCQDKMNEFGCPQKDDMQGIVDKILEADLIILATPIYAWYCTAPMKIMLDRLSYGMNKFFGSQRGTTLWEGKECAIIATCGYKVEKGADIFQQGIKRLCRHSYLNYIGMLAIQDLGYNVEFMTPEIEEKARTFAGEIIKQIHC